jgi:hypothetical protein
VALSMVLNVLIHGPELFYLRHRRAFVKSVNPTIYPHLQLLTGGCFILLYRPVAPDITNYLVEEFISGSGL